MSKNLLIVESPAKAKTIEKYLGKDFTVKASYGHVRDLPKGDKAIDINNGFEPHYEVMEDKVKVIKELKDLIKKHDQVWLATDEDREGEAISWHLAQALDLDMRTTPRIVFNEITKTAIQRAIQNPRFIDHNLVNAQQARRILDRIVGFRLSPVLWRKVKAGLSAGRVQSVAVRLIVEREREIMGFEATSTYKVTAEFILPSGTKLQAELASKVPDLASARAFLESCIGATYTITDLVKKPAKKSPAAPFTTSTLQQEASRKLSFSVAQTMRVAQTLYEAGKITYMRTDSVALSDQARGEAAQTITSRFGDKYSHPRQYQNKNANAQEAHEAIRPTDFNVSQIDDLPRNEQRLYELIWKRTLASQMANAELERTTVDITTSTNGALFKATGEVLLFDGFLKLYLEGTDDEEEEEQEGVLPPMKVGEVLGLSYLEALERYSRPAPRYTEASLVKKLEELGIGRPSTYAPTISTIQNRGYVEKEDREGTPRQLSVLRLDKNGIKSQTKSEITGAEKSKLFPTDLGMVVNDFLTTFFPAILDFHFTAKMEEQFDHIATGRQEWRTMLDDFYKDFSPTVDHISETAERASGDRELGIDPKSGKPVIARLGRFGPIVQIGSSEDEEKPRFASLRKNMRLESVTLEEALELFKLPRTLGEFEEEVVKANIGRFGPYIQLGKLFVSLEETDDVNDIDLDRAIELIHLKREKEANKVIATLAPDVQVLQGRWGPYLKMRGENVKIPKDVNPATITMEDAERLFVESQGKPKRGPSKSAAKAPAAKTAPAKKAPPKKKK